MARTKEQVLDAIKRLLAMTVERGCTEAEAATAVSMVQSMLQKYKLDMAEVPTEDRETEPEMRKTTLNVEGKGHDGTWKFTLLNRVARYNFCRAVLTVDSNKSYLFGGATDVEVVILLHNWIIEQLERICSAMWKEYDGQDRRPTWRRSFFTAAVSTIGNRLYEQYHQFESSGEKSTALIVVSKEAVDTYVHKSIGPTHRVRSGGSNGSMGGSIAGVVAGHMVNLDKPNKRLGDGS